MYTQSVHHIVHVILDLLNKFNPTEEAVDKKNGSFLLKNQGTTKTNNTNKTYKSSNKQLYLHRIFSTFCSDNPKVSSSRISRRWTTTYFVSLFQPTTTWVSKTSHLSDTQTLLPHSKRCCELVRK